MKAFIEEHGKTILYFIIVFLFIGIIYIAFDGTKPTVVSDTNNNVGTNETIAKIDKPKISVTKSTVIKKGITFIPLEYVNVLDSSKKDITENVIVYGEVDSTTKGAYDIRYTVRDSYGLFSDKKVTFVVD